MVKKKLSVDDVAIILNEDGVEEAILYSIEADEIEDEQLSLLWTQAKTILEDINSFIDANVEEDDLDDSEDEEDEDNSKYDSNEFLSDDDI